MRNIKRKEGEGLIFANDQMVIAMLQVLRQVSIVEDSNHVVTPSP